MQYSSSRHFLSVENFLFSQPDQPESENKLDSGFDQIIGTEEGDSYLDPGFHDLTRDHRPENDWHRGRKKTLFCFHCNRPETHAPALRHFWQYSFLVGLTLGFIKFIGPFYCRCCGHRRLIAADWLNPRYWLLMRRLRSSSQRRKNW